MKILQRRLKAVTMQSTLLDLNCLPQRTMMEVIRKSC